MSTGFFANLGIRPAIELGDFLTLKTITLGFGTMLLAGCYSPPEVNPRTTTPTQIPAKQTPSAFPRFVPIDRDTDKMGVPWFGFFALDTQTGQLCRTADWQLKESWGTLPTCVSLSKIDVGEKTMGFKEWQEQQEKKKSDDQK